MLNQIEPKPETPCCPHSVAWPPHFRRVASSEGVRFLKQHCCRLLSRIHLPTNLHHMETRDMRHPISRLEIAVPVPNIDPIWSEDRTGQVVG